MRNLEPKFYLYVGRLVKYKKVDLLIKVFNKSKKPLLIIGMGSEEKNLKSKSKRNIKFVGEVSDKELVKYYQSAKALIMPQEEDFGLVSVEAQSFGVPVIAYKKGGAVDTVVEGETGIFFNKQNPESLTYVIEKFEKMSFNYKLLTVNAKKFSKESFKTKFSRLI